MDQVNITYYGHACFALEYDGYRIVIDPYRHGSVPGNPNLDLTANAVYCSHEHFDHNYTDAVKLFEKDSLGCAVAEYTTPHDDKDGTLRGMNTVRIFRFGDLRVAHLGDIGIFPEEPLLSELKGVDCLLIPVGGFYTIDSATAKQIVDAVCPRVCIPMHYRTDNTGFDVISHINDFTKLFDGVQFRDNSFVLTKDTLKQILVLNYKP